MDDEEIGFGLVALLLLLFSGGKKKPDDGPSGDPNVIPIPGHVVPIPGTYVPPEPPPEPEPEPGERIPLPDIIDPYPRPATFYPVQKGDTGYGIAYRYLRSAGFLAATKFGKLDAAAANQFAVQVAKGVQRQVKVWKGIQCNGFNDAAFATYGYKGSSVPGPHGRAIRLLPQHVDILERIAGDQSVLRNMKWRRPKDKGKGGGVGANNSFREYETLWLPGCKLKVLWDSDGKTVEFGGKWSNGATKLFPPPWILRLGIEFIEGADPGVTDFGCMGMEMEL